MRARIQLVCKGLSDFRSGAQTVKEQAGFPSLSPADLPVRMWSRPYARGFHNCGVRLPWHGRA